MGLELQLEDIILLNAVCLHRSADCIAEQWETGQGIIILEQPNSPALSARHPLPPSSSQPALILVYRTANTFVLSRKKQEEKQPLSFARPLTADNETFPHSFHWFYSHLLLFPCPLLPPGLPVSPPLPLSGTPSTDLTQKLKYSSQKKCALKSRNLDKINAVYWVNKMKRHQVHCSTDRYQAGTDCTPGRRIPDACLTVLSPAGREMDKTLLIPSPPLITA